MYYGNKILKEYGNFILSLVLAFALSLCFTFKAFAANMSPDYKCCVMGPLEKVDNWSDFKKQLITLKNNGVYAITTDVWWGYVESEGDNKFDWSYYKTYGDTVRAAGLKWIPIISTHECGSNVGDSVNIPLPSWLWEKDTADNMKFKDENGVYNKETLSPWWADTAKQYDELYESFASNFSSYKDIIAKIYLSSGPAGELRFPSYNPSTGWSRGFLQCYTKAAKLDFQNAMKNKYDTISRLNSEWGTSLKSFEQVSPPTDGDNFFVNGYKTTYGNDFLTWYQGVLIKHLSNIAIKAHNRFDPVFGVAIGAKVSGVHWLMNSPNMPHAAEYCTGYYNYSTLLDQFKKSNLDLTFTCLEKEDSNPYNYPYSAPKSLVINIANLAREKGIKYFGENASDIYNNKKAYENCAEMLFNYDFSGFTLLRLKNIVNYDGTPNAEMDHFADILAIKPVPVTFTVNNVNLESDENLYLTGSRWEMANWSTEFYPLQFKNNNGSYTITTHLAEGHNYEFKAIKKNNNGNVIWQGSYNQFYNVPKGGDSYTWSW